MKKNSITFRIDDDTYKKLSLLANATNKPKSFFIREALRIYLQKHYESFLNLKDKTTLDEIYKE